MTYSLLVQLNGQELNVKLRIQESRAVARKPRDAAAVLFGLKFADNIHIIHYKFKSSQASKSRLQSSKHTGAKHNLMQNGHSRSFKPSRSRVLESVGRRPETK